MRASYFWYGSSNPVSKSFIWHHRFSNKNDFLARPTHRLVRSSNVLKIKQDKKFVEFSLPEQRKFEKWMVSCKSWKRWSVLSYTYRLLTNQIVGKPVRISCHVIITVLSFLLSNPFIKRNFWMTRMYFFRFSLHISL